MSKLFKKNWNTKGFTLIELVIYIGIVSVFLILGSNFAWDIIKSDTKINCYREVQQNARFAMERVTQELRAGEDPKIFTVSEGVLYQEGIALTTNKVEVTVFDITSFVDTYKINLTVEYDSLEKSNEYKAMASLESTVVLLEGATSTPSENCWGDGGLCDPFCQYFDEGRLMSYYVDPGCIEECSPAGSFYIGPGGTCSDDGTGLCYKMEDSSTEYLSCSQGDSCEGKCGGTCTPCQKLDWRDCVQQEGCTLIPMWPPRCVGRCTSCEKFGDEGGCGGQLGCEWNSTKWYWVLNNSSLGYSTFTKCEWYEQ